MNSANLLFPHALVPYHSAEAITCAQAAQISGMSPNTMRAWAETHGIGRQMVSGAWAISRVALQIALEGDHSALAAYHRGVRREPIVSEYYRRAGIAYVLASPQFQPAPTQASQSKNVQTAHSQKSARSGSTA